MSSGAADKLIYEFSAFRLDPVERLLLRDGRAVPITPKAFDLLVYLLERHGRLVEKHALMAALWPDTVVEEANLAYNVSALRRVLDEGEEAASVIQTVPTRGYRFVAPVKTSRRILADSASDGEAVPPGLPESETLAAQLTHGPLPLTQQLRIGIDIADALEVSHRQGIVHGGLTPGNVIAHTGGRQASEFRPGQHDGHRGDSDVHGTRQVLGLPTDARTDIYALGAILHEMAAGQQAPAALNRIVQGCLAKDPVDRWQSAHDVKLQLQGIQEEFPRVEATAPPTLARRRTMWIPWAVAAACVALAATMLTLSSRSVVPQTPPVRFDLIVPPEMRVEDYNRGAISPDGQRFVFEATVDGLQRLVLRDLASATLVVLVETDGGYNPFWSPDSQSVAFFDMESQLKLIAVTGRPVRVLAKTTYGHGFGLGGTWGPGVILFGSGEGRIYRVAATGGTPAPSTRCRGSPDRGGIRLQGFFPDGRHFLVTVVDDPALYVASLDAPGMRKVMDEGASAVYAAGHLFYSRGTGVFARPFDAERLEFSGPRCR